MTRGVHWGRVGWIVAMAAWGVCPADRPAAAQDAPRDGAPAAASKTSAPDPATIRQAQDIAQATEALAAARKADPTNPKIYQAFIERALALGRPQRAQAAAKELARLQGENALARGLLGYCLAVRGQVMEASDELMKAAAAADNPGIMFNVGLLAQWKQTDPARAQVAPNARRMLDDHLAQWKDKPGFSEGAAAADKVLAVRQKQVDVVAARLEAAQKKVQELDKPKMAIPVKGEGKAQKKGKNKVKGGGKAQKKGKNKAADDPLAAQRGQALKQQQAAEKKMAGAEQAVKKIRANLPANANANQVNKAAKAIQKQRQAYLQARAEQAKAARRLKELDAMASRQEGPLNAAKAAVENIEKQIDRINTSVPGFAWRPPALNGKATRDQEARGGSARGDDAANSPAATASRLKMAKALIRNNRPDAAMKALEEIIAASPDSDTAKEAQQLLDLLEAQKKQ